MTNDCSLFHVGLEGQRWLWRSHPHRLFDSTLSSFKSSFRVVLPLGKEFKDLCISDWRLIANSHNILISTIPQKKKELSHGREINKISNKFTVKESLQVYRIQISKPWFRTFFCPSKSVCSKAMPQHVKFFPTVAHTRTLKFPFFLFCLCQIFCPQIKWKENRLYIVPCRFRLSNKEQSQTKRQGAWRDNSQKQWTTLFTGYQNCYIHRYSSWSHACPKLYLCSAPTHLNLLEASDNWSLQEWRFLLWTDSVLVLGMQMTKTAFNIIVTVLIALVTAII